MTILSNKDHCYKLNNEIKRFIYNFLEQWYDYPDIHIIWESSDSLNYSIFVNDLYISLDDIFTCMWYSIPYEAYIHYYSEQVEKKPKKKYNLKNWYQLYLDSKDVEND